MSEIIITIDNEYYDFSENLEIEIKGFKCLIPSIQKEIIKRLQEQSKGD